MELVTENLINEKYKRKLESLLLFIKIFINH